MSTNLEIMKLMEVFDLVDSSFREIHTPEDGVRWKPQGPAESEALQALTSLEKRTALKTWYSSFPALNPHADLFRQVLERLTGEPLPTAGSLRRNV